MTYLRTLTAAGALLAGTAFAGAADLPGGLKDTGTGLPASTYNWSGFYLGGNLGYSTAGTRGDTDAAGYLSTATVPYTAVIAQPSMNGLTGGVQTGVNVQRGALVGGVVTDFQGTDLKGVSAAKPDVYYSGVSTGLALPLTQEQSVSWFGTVRGKLGVSIDRFLVYGTGGYAYGYVNDKISTAFPGAGTTNYSVDNGGIRSGYTVGGGVEYGVGQWSFGAEYLYVDLGAGSIGADVVVDPSLTVHVKTGGIESDFHTVRGTINYRW
jgi:outer membrane immunogenic protein